MAQLNWELWYAIFILRYKLMASLLFSRRLSVCSYVRPSYVIPVSEVPIPSNMSVALNLCFLCNLGSPNQSNSIRIKTRHAPDTTTLQLLFKISWKYLQWLQRYGADTICDRQTERQITTGIQYVKIVSGFGGEVVWKCLDRQTTEPILPITPPSPTPTPLQASDLKNRS